MPVEIERKFLVRDNRWQQLGTGQLIRQGYLNSDKQRTVRVRVAGEQAWLTIKGQPDGIVRAEYEYAIPLEDGRAMLEMCVAPLIEKYRYRIPHAEHVWEVDQFLGENEGLVVAEIELTSADQPFQLPDWIGEEVTADRRYANSALSKSPYRSWSE